MDVVGTPLGRVRVSIPWGCPPFGSLGRTPLRNATRFPPLPRVQTRHERAGLGADLWARPTHSLEKLFVERTTRFLGGIKGKRIRPFYRTGTGSPSANMGATGRSLYFRPCLPARTSRLNPISSIVHRIVLYCPSVAFCSCLLLVRRAAQRHGRTAVYLYKHALPTVWPSSWLPRPIRRAAVPRTINTVQLPPPSHLCATCRLTSLYCLP
jgi:hypothetical protein